CGPSWAARRGTRRSARGTRGPWRGTASTETGASPPRRAPGPGTPRAGSSGGPVGRAPRRVRNARGYSGRVTSDLSHLMKAYDVRGTVPDQLNPQVARAVGAAFARAVVLPEAPAGSGDAPSRPRVVVGHDMRDSGPALVDAFAAGLTDAGV